MTIRSQWIGLALIGFVSLLSGIGCGGPRVEHLTGRVLLDGKPLNGVDLYFRPDEGTGFVVPETADDGRFDYRRHPQAPRVIAGNYQVIVVDPVNRYSLRTPPIYCRLNSPLFVDLDFEMDLPDLELASR